MTSQTGLRNGLIHTRRRNTTASADLIKRLKADSEGGPTVCFIAYDGDRSILVEGTRTLGRDNITVLKRSQSVTLMYTVEEWNAFLSGVRNGVFDDLAAGPRTDIVPLRDSKNPDGPALTFLPTHMNRFFMAIKSGKYDI